MGLLDKLKEKGRGIVTAAKPADGVEPQSPDQVRDRLLAISGNGIEVTAEGEEILVSWSAKITAAGGGSAGYEFLYRAIRLELSEDDRSAEGICFKTTTEAELEPGGFSGFKTWERGQHVGSETVQVIAWLGPHQTEGAADEGGYKFSWSDLRDPVIDAVTGAGWTYKPKKF